MAPWHPKGAHSLGQPMCDCRSVQPAALARRHNNRQNNEQGPRRLRPGQASLDTERQHAHVAREAVVGRGCRVTAQLSPRIFDAWHAVGDLLFPTACVFCGVELVSHEPGHPLLCARCVGRLTSGGQPACQLCASPLPKFWPDQGGCPKCLTRRYFFSRSAALGYYRSEMQQAVLRMKRTAFEPLTHSMGLLLADQVRTWYHESRRRPDRAGPHALVAPLAAWRTSCPPPGVDRGPIHLASRLFAVTEVSAQGK